MGKWDHLTEPPLFVIKGLQEFVVLPFAEAEQELSPRTEGELGIEIFDDAWADGFLQLFVVVVVVVLSVFREAKRAGGGNVKILIEGIRATHFADPAVDEVSAQFRPAGKIMLDITLLAQHLRPGEGYARHSCTMTTGVDARHKNAVPVIGEVFLVEDLHASLGFFFSEGVEEVYAFGELPVGLEGIYVKVQDFLGEGH